MEGMEGQCRQGQVPAPRNRHSHGDSRRGSREATQGPEEGWSTPEPEEEPSDSEEPTKDDEGQEQTSYPAPPGTAAGQVAGLGGHSQPVAPDGGWGWMVLIATILVLALTLAFPSCLGIFYTDLQTEFNASNTETSWVPAIMMAVLHAGGRTRR